MSSNGKGTKRCENCNHTEYLSEVVYGDRTIYLCDLCAETDLGAHVFLLDGMPHLTPSMLAQSIWWLRNSLITEEE